MLKIIVPIILFIILVFAISSYWEKANTVNRKKITLIVSTVLIATLSLTLYLIID